ncbi:MAG: LptF/LptG family permease, partial [Cyanobacteria bacterium J06633_1]
ALPKTALDITKTSRKTSEMNFFQARKHLELIRPGADEQRIRKWQVRIQEKIAVPFACLVFAMIGAVLGVQPQDSGKATSFGICIGLIFGYYLLSFISQSLGISGAIAPWLAAWLPNFLGLGTATGLLAKATD